MILSSRLIAALAYAGAAFLFGVAMGERGELGFVQQLFLYVIPIATLVLTVVTHSAGRPYVLFTGAMMLAGLLLGQRQFANAWNECVVRGPEVQAKLVRYHEQYDAYPARLDELGDVPCRCGFRPTILRYLSNERGFRLWMTNGRKRVVFATR